MQVAKFGAMQDADAAGIFRAWPLRLKKVNKLGSLDCARLMLKNLNHPLGAIQRLRSSIGVAYKIALF